jgi:hypothetical protein
VLLSPKVRGENAILNLSIHENSKNKEMPHVNLLTPSESKRHVLKVDKII